MSFWSRIGNVFQRDRLNRELNEEIQAHIEEAITHGRSPSEARRAFGKELHLREESHDIKVAQRLDSLRADAVFGVRQLFRHRVTSGAAIVSLALAIGACTAAFRLIDAALLRPLPVAEPGSLYFLTYRNADQNGKPDVGDSFEYPLFRELRASVKNDAELLAISYTSRIDLTYSRDEEMEKAHRQYVSGAMFPSFGLKPAVGRLLTPADDLKPSAHPYAVLSYEYWARRFGQDPRIVGRTFRTGNDLYEIVGVSPQGFTGTEPGTFTDIFIPTMMNAEAIEHRNWGWFRTWLRVKPQASTERVRQQLQATFVSSRRENAKDWFGEVPRQRIDEYVNAPLVLEPASTGASGLQKDYRRSLAILGVLVTLVLLIACANVANLLTVQTASRAREMALRISIGAGRWRLVQLMLVESTIIALLASGLGGLFAWWSAPVVVSMLNPPDNPARLILPADWRVLGFGIALAVVVTLMFGLAPAVRASSVKPMITLKGGNDPHSRRRLMNGLVAAQVAFCFLVHFLAGLFIATFERISKQPLGFSAEGVLTLETSANGAQPAAYWDQVMSHLQRINGVESAALGGWALMSGNGWSGDISIDGRPPEMDRTYFLSVSPAWLKTMQIGLQEGRDFRPDDTHPAVGIVNEAFARRYFNGQNPVGKSFERTEKKKRVRTEIVGWVRDAQYRNMREPIRPTVYVPFHETDEKTSGLRSRNWGTFVVRTSASNPMVLAPMLRKEVTRARPELRVATIRTQTELVEQHTIRERLLATLSLFFAMVALVLAGVGLYGVLNYSVLQRQREIGIRMALGAGASHVVWRVTAEVFGMLLLGAIAGLAAGAVTERYVETLLYQVKATELTLWVLPTLTILAAALLAILPPVVRAVRIDPAQTLRAE